MFFNLLAMAVAVGAADAGPSANEFIFSRYPARALAAGEQGSVKFRVDIDENGIVQSCKVTGSSGFERLDNETCDLMIQHAKFNPVRDSEGIARRAVHDGVVNWRIPGAAKPTQVASVGGQAPDKVICKRIQKTGSLVASSRVCMTAREWSQQADQYQDEYGALQGRQGSTNGH